MKMFRSLGHVIGGSLLIAGTTIGVGMLALPVATASAGFIPSMLVYLCCWAFMLATGLLFVEICMWMPRDTSFISMASNILGPVGKNLFWILYLFLFISVMIAHASGGGAVFLDITNLNIPSWAATFLYSLLFAPVVYLGAKSVDRINIVLITSVVICYVLFICLSLSHVKYENLAFVNWKKTWISLPILFTAFTYQVIIPTLMTYLDRNIHKVRLAIIFGSTIPLVIYLIWQFLILGIVPAEGLNGLIQAGIDGKNAVWPLKEYVPIVFYIGKYFAFFAMTTSFIPLALSFFDFLADGLKWQKKGTKRLALCSIVFGAPVIISILYPNIFLKALGYAGGISCALLFGFFPPLMVWFGRYKKRYSEIAPQIPGGKAILILLMSFAILIMLGEIIQQFIF